MQVPVLNILGFRICIGHNKKSTVNPIYAKNYLGVRYLKTEFLAESRVKNGRFELNADCDSDTDCFCWWSWKKDLTGFSNVQREESYKTGKR